MMIDSQKHYENLKSWVDKNLLCEHDDPVWNKEAYEVVHFILDDYKKRIDSQLAVEEIDYLIRRQSFTREHATITEAINRSESIINKLEKQKEMLEK